ncbi:MAG TPA: CBS domain-containing protein [Gemmatimonadaceae bacterium]|nr:CBS domain-containing protein [Gemmatimonadaceae bacterium]
MLEGAEMTMHGMRMRTTDAGERTFSLLGAFGTGAALMYILDPGRGTRRRRLAADKVVHASRSARDALGATARDFEHRARGVVAETGSRLRREQPDDVVLVARVRSELGRVASHPSAIEVAADNGRVTLTGPVLAGEAGRVLRAVRGVRGVREVDNHLEPHDSPDGVPGLQGGSRQRRQRGQWAPATRFVTSAVGTALALYGARCGHGIGRLLGLTGLALTARGVSNLSARRLTGIAAGRRAVDVRKTVTIARPVDEVFEYFTEWENWPRFMSHVREVRSIGLERGQERTHWVVDGPVGVPLSWDALVTRLVPNELLAWKSVEGAAVRHAGVIRFVPTPQGGTRVDVRMSYNPPAGAVGHVVAAFFGRDPRRQLDDDLARLKTALETGVPPRDAAQPAREAAASADAGRGRRHRRGAEAHHQESRRREQMRADEIMTRNPTTVTPDDTARHVAQLMADHDCGSLPVVEGGGSNRVIGVVTDRDLALRGLAQGRGPDTPVRELMTRDPTSCPANADIDEVERLMADRQLRRIVVVDEDHRCIGIIAQADLARAAERGGDVTEREVARVVERISEPSRRPTSRASGQGALEQQI